MENAFEIQRPKVGVRLAQGRRLPSVTGYGVLASTVSALILALAGALLYFLAVQQAEELRQDQREARAAIHAAKTAALVRNHAIILERWSGTPQVTRAIVGGDPHAIERQERELSRLLPSLLRARLLPPGFNTVDANSTPPLSFAGLELVRRAAATDGVTLAEAHLFATPQQHFSIARRATNEAGVVVGVVLAIFPVDSLQDALRAPDLSEAYLELQQNTVDHTPFVLASEGQPSLREQGVSARVSVPGTRWQIAYWQAPAPLLFGASGLLLAIGLIVGAILVLALANLSIFGRLSRALRKDQITIINLVEDMVNGQPHRDYPVHVSNSHGTVELLMGISKEFSSARHAPRGAQELADEHSDDDPFADELFPEGGLEVETIERAQGVGVPASIFRAYDIRGVVGQTLTAEIVHQIGRAIGSELEEQGQKEVLVARDGRLSGQELADGLSQGLQAAGCDVIDIGMVPTPVLYFATHYLGCNSGVMVTGSHNPPNYNGLKVVMDGEALFADSIQALRRRIDNGHFVTGGGSSRTQIIVPDYLDRITNDVHVARPLKVVVDCGNGVSGGIVPELLRRLGCTVVELFCEVDGNFPNHHPNPSKPENLTSLMRAVREQAADLGVAFDGDGDRLVAIDARGGIIWPDRLLMLFSRDLLARQPGADIIYDIKCSRHLPRVIAQHGGHPHMWKTGHSFTKARLKEIGAMLAGELSGHIVFKDRWYGFDDAQYACARLLEILSDDPRSTSEVFGDFPRSINTPELEIQMAEGQAPHLMERLLEKAQFPGAKITTLDGLRVDFEDAWGLVRASNTMPSLVLRFEAESEEALQRIQNEFRTLLLELDPALLIPY